MSRPWILIVGSFLLTALAVPPAAAGESWVALGDGGELHLVRADPEKLEVLDTQAAAESEALGDQLQADLESGRLAELVVPI